MSENAAEAAREAIKAAVRGMIEMDRTYDETRAMIEDAGPTSHLWTWLPW